MLLGLDAGGSGGLLAERQKAAQLVAEGSQHAEVEGRDARLFQLAATSGKDAFFGARARICPSSLLHEPQPVPALVAAHSASTVSAPAATASHRAPSVTLWQLQTRRVAGSAAGARSTEHRDRGR